LDTDLSNTNDVIIEAGGRTGIQSWDITVSRPLLAQDSSDLLFDTATINSIILQFGNFFCEF
jgi:hypothetical protein